MAINDSSANTNAVPERAIQSTGAPIPTAAKSVPTPRTANWFGSQDGLGRTPVERGLGTEQLALLKSGIEKLISDNRTQFNSTDWTLEMIPIEKGMTKLHYSALVITLVSKNDLKNKVAVHSLILEATGDRIAPRYETINGQQVEIVRTATDAYDGVFIDIVNTRVKSLYKQSDIVNAEATVVPRSFNAADPLAINTLLSSALFACHNALIVLVPGFQDVCLTAARNTQMRVEHFFTKAQIADAVGQPVRNDITVVFSERQPVQTSGSINNTDSNRTFSTINGFIDLVYNPVEQPLYGNYGQFQQPGALPPTIRYAAHYVITNIDTQVASTLPAQLLAISTATTLRENDSWKTTFSHAGGGTARKNDTNDIGAVGFEVNIAKVIEGPNTTVPDGVRIDTKHSNFTTQQLGQLLGLTVRPGLAFSLDVPDCGPTTSYLSIFAAAALGNLDAHRTIIKAANYLTDNNFLNFFKNDGRIFADVGMPIHLGTYTDSDGTIRDLRDIDYLGILNVTGDKGLDVVKAWSNTFNAVHEPIAVRFAARKNILMNVVPNVEITGRAVRVTFDAGFLDALASAIYASGLVVSVDTLRSLNDFNQQRGGSAMMGNAMMTGSTHFVHQGGYFNNNTQGNVGYLSPRWAGQ